MFLISLLVLFSVMLSACSHFEARPFPGMETVASSASEAVTQPSSELPSESETTVAPENTDFPTEQIAPDALEQQLQLIMSCSDLWEYRASSTEICSYCVTDLDHNGRLEIIMSAITTTGYLSYTQCLEVNETFDALESCVTTELNADIQPMETVICYTDGNVFYYAVSDQIQTIWQEANLNRLALKLEDGKLTEELLVCASNASTASSADITSVYTDADGRPISQTDYKNIYETQFSGWKSAQFGLGWIGGNYSIPNLDMLRSSYEAFRVMP